LATWTRAALSSNSRRLAGTAWRVVEAQHVVSTMGLVDTLEEQAALERVLERSKPNVPPECRHLHYLLSTPFRYGAPHPTGSRFRSAGVAAGVFYASARVEAAVSEMAFHRLLFYAESPATPWPANAAEYTAFTVRYRGTGLDLTTPPLDRDRASWTTPIDYRPCQALAAAARDAGVQVLRYQSARGEGRNVALLVCRAFATTAPGARQTWRLHAGPVGVRAICDAPDLRLAFDRAAFALDPRIASMPWER
jgi:hypothetical protein